MPLFLYVDDRFVDDLLCHALQAISETDCFERIARHDRCKVLLVGFFPFLDLSVNRLGCPCFDLIKILNDPALVNKPLQSFGVLVCHITEENELIELRKRVKELEMEADILKQAALIMARKSK